MSISQYIEAGKNVAAALGVGGVLWGAYASSGLPVPATIKQVEEKIAAVNDTIKKNQSDTTAQIESLRSDNLEGQRAVIRLTRVGLRNEQSALERVIVTADPTAKVTMGRRLGEISDQLKELDANDAELRTRIGELKTLAKDRR